MKETIPATKIYLDDNRPNPMANIKMLTSNKTIIDIESGLVVLDIDPKNGGYDPRDYFS